MYKILSKSLSICQNFAKKFVHIKLCQEAFMNQTLSRTFYVSNFVKKVLIAYIKICQKVLIY